MVFQVRACGGQVGSGFSGIAGFVNLVLQVMDSGFQVMKSGHSDLLGFGIWFSSMWVW